ncbi:hypothetical protein [Desulfitobacterium metallireducens]|uniref:Uncharacterized protein n=1 Tax=Desulfitobacterium metallireducens DSM 15288 TaxID=871968 RepID=W0EEP7_9FIRM|nr:hypothetical protein [Desulfitobacterium metallireducens]AHF08003.1 hypothetical protein DESME_13920 [Desulfitobacterium metallireducens DSM 15288]
MNSYGPGPFPVGNPQGRTFPNQMPPARIPPGGIFSPTGPDYSESGFRKTITFLQSPAIGADFIAITIFFLIVFSTNILFTSANLATIGIIVALSTLAFIALILLILFSL